MDQAVARPRVVCSGCDLSRAGDVMLAWSDKEASHASVSRLAALVNDCEEFVGEFDADKPTLFILEGLLEYLDPTIHLPLFRILSSAVSEAAEGCSARKAKAMRSEGSPSPGHRHMVALQNLEPSFGGQSFELLRPMSCCPPAWRVQQGSTWIKAVASHSVLESFLAETFNRDKKLPYQALVASADQEHALRCVLREG